MATPDPSNVAPWYLRNINQALALDEPTGNVYLRTGFEGNIIISGNVNIPGNVDAHISEIGTSGNLTVPWMPVSIDGNSNVTVSGNVNANITGGNVNAAVSGTVAVSSITGNIAGITANVTVVDGGGSLTVDGNVGVTGNVNIGTMPPITGNVYVTGTPAITVISDYYMNIARGQVPGQSAVSKNGFVTGVNQNDEVTIWGEAVTYPWASWTVAQKLYILSTSTSDTGQTLRIEGVDASYNRLIEDVVTNGTTAVATTNNFLRINHCYMIAGNTNVGKITQRLTSGTGTVVGSMAIGFARNKGGFYTVPNGYTAYIMYGAATQFRAGSGNIGGVVKMYTRTPAVPTGPFILQYVAEVVNGSFRNDFTVPLMVPEKTDIDVRIVADGNGTQGTCSWQMILVANT